MQPLLPHHGDALGDGAVLVRHGEHPLPALVHLPEKLRELPQCVGAEDQIHVGVGLLHPLGNPLLLGHAAAKTDDLLGVFLFRVGQGAQVAEDPVLGVLPDGAGVQNHQVRLRRVRCEGEAAALQHAHEFLAVGHVLLAAEGIHAGHRVGLTAFKHGPDFLFKRLLALQVLPAHQYLFPFQNSSSKFRYFN